MPENHQFTFKRIAAAMLATASLTGMAVVAAPTASAAPCGFFTDKGRHLYNHCRGGNVAINIHWDNFLGRDNSEVVCVGPGITQIGVPTSGRRIDAAWAIGPC